MAPERRVASYGSPRAPTEKNFTTPSYPYGNNATRLQINAFIPIVLASAFKSGFGNKPRCVKYDPRAVSFSRPILLDKRWFSCAISIEMSYLLIVMAEPRDLSMTVFFSIVIRHQSKQFVNLTLPPPTQNK